MVRCHAAIVLLAACGGAKQATAPTESEPAPDFQLVTPEGLTFDAEGSLYITDCEGFRIFKLEPSGRLTLVAGIGGTGYGAFSGDGGLSDKAELACPVQLVFDADQMLYFVDHGNNRIRTVDQEGEINTFAGSGPAGVNLGSFAGDGGPAAEARLQEPTGLTIDAEGNVYVADRDNQRIRRIGRDGVITTFAGTDAGFRGDGGPAAKAKLWDPYYLAFGPDGSLYVADNHNNRLRRIGPDGVITTIAGTGDAASSGDGGPANEASLNEPYGVAVDASGNVYVSESAGQRVRKIDAAGIISTVAGTGELGFSGDGGPATKAALNSPAGLAVDGEGNLYIADYDNGRVRLVENGVIRTIAGG